MRETNATFSNGRLFRKACDLADILATTRQASKYRRGLGIAARFKQKALIIANQELIEEVFNSKKGRS